MHKLSNESEYRQALREKILEEATSCFNERGIRAVKMDDIASCLSISKRTLYKIFRDKEELVLETAKKRFCDKEKMMDAFMQTNPNVIEVVLEIYKHQVEELSNTNPLMYSDLHKYTKVLDLISEHKRDNNKNALAFFNKGVEEGFFRNDIRYDILLELADVQMNYIMSTKFYLKYPFIDIYKNLLLVTVRGFATEKGVKILEEFFKKLDK